MSLFTAHHIFYVPLSLSFPHPTGWPLPNSVLSKTHPLSVWQELLKDTLLFVYMQMQLGTQIFVYRGLKIGLNMRAKLKEKEEGNTGKDGILLLLQIFFLVVIKTEAA